MSKILYQFNPESVNFEKVEIKNRFNFLKIIAYIFTTIIFGSLITWFLSNNLETPKERILTKENKDLLKQYNQLSEKINMLEVTFDDFQQRDDHLYRVLFDASPVPIEIRTAGIGGNKRYEHIEKMNNSTLLVNINTKVDKLLKQVYIQSKSYEELENLARDKKNLLESMPAIMPLAKKFSRYAVSGWGYRTHPIYKIKKFHYGLDFPALRGTPVYATGNGIIKKASYNRFGYGKHVIIDHGFGYETLYAHMNDYSVKPGQKVKRGDIIGYSGSTGLSVAPHLHYEVIKDNVKVNPANYIFNDLTTDEYHLLVNNANTSGQSLD